MQNNIIMERKVEISDQEKLGAKVEKRGKSAPRLLKKRGKAHRKKAIVKKIEQK